MQKVRPLDVVIAGRSIRLHPAEVERAARDAVPEPIRDHFVIVGGRPFPPKQLIALVTGIDRADFTTNQARAILRRLGLPTGRAGDLATAGPRTAGSRTSEAAAPYRSGGADALRPHIGKWVVVKDGEVLVATASPGEALSWLRRNRARGDSMFRVPLDPSADIGGFAG